MSLLPRTTLHSDSEHLLLQPYSFLALLPLHLQPLHLLGIATIKRFWMPSQKVVNASERLLEVHNDKVHYIVTTGQLIAPKFHRLHGEKLETVTAEFKQLQEDSIIQRSTSL
jgi:hypothetical protein